MPSKTETGMVSVRSHHSVEETVERVQAALDQKGIKLFAVIDHSGEAKAAGLAMRPTQLVIFGNPVAGTPLMLASPSVAIDLPLKLLVWEDAESSVWVTYNSPEYLRERHGLPEELVQNIAGIAGLAAAVAE